MPLRGAPLHHVHHGASSMRDGYTDPPKALSV